MNDYVEGEYFYSDGELFRIIEGMDLSPERDAETANRIAGKLSKFKLDGISACENNHLIEKKESSNRITLKVSPKEETFIRSLTIDGLSPDKKFEQAQTYAFSHAYFECRAILKTLLNGSPNFHDARILMARTFAWSQEYDSAMVYLNQTIRRAPHYADTYSAWSDVEYWRANYKMSLEVAENGLIENENNCDLLTRKARALIFLDRKPEAKRILKEILKQNKEAQLATLLQSQINNENHDH